MPILFTIMPGSTVMLGPTGHLIPCFNPVKSHHKIHFLFRQSAKFLYLCTVKEFINLLKHYETNN